MPGCVMPSGSWLSSQKGSLCTAVLKEVSGKSVLILVFGPVSR